MKYLSILSPLLFCLMLSCKSSTEVSSHDDVTLDSHTTWKPGYYESPKDFEKLSNDIATADHHLEYMRNDQLSIGIRDIQGRSITRETHSLEELSQYFENSKHKKFVTVMFHKATPAEKSLDEAINELNTFFFKFGYQRVLLTGASAMGMSVYSDRNNPN